VTTTIETEPLSKTQFLQATLPSTTLREYLAWLCRRRRLFRVTGRSMWPLLDEGILVLVNHRAYVHHVPQAGDIVLAYHPYQRGLKIVKQVETVEVSPTTGEQRYFLIGLNPDPLASTDSRSFGALSADKILGQVTSVLRN